MERGVNVLRFVLKNGKLSTFFRVIHPEKHFWEKGDLIDIIFVSWLVPGEKKEG